MTGSRVWRSRTRSEAAHAAAARAEVSGKAGNPARPLLVIFDFDGTLADSFPWFARNLNAVADRFRFRRADPADLEMLRGCDARQIMAHLGIPLWKVPLIARHMRALAARSGAEIRLFPGIADMLLRLSEAGITLAIVSSNGSATIRRTLGPGTAGLIDHFACGAGLFAKAGKLRRVLRRSGIGPEAALSIGDELRDQDAADAVGIAFAAVSWGYTSPAALAARGPAMLFDRPADIAATLCGSPDDGAGGVGGIGSAVP